MLTQDILKERLHYDPITGWFTWLKATRRFLAKRAGTVRSDGYRFIRIKGQDYSEAHLAVLYMTGEWPLHEVDHEDRNRSNNIWQNLRSATRRENVLNTVKVKASGLPRGVGISPWGKYHARVTINGIREHLGYFDTAAKAHEAYLAAVQDKAFLPKG